MTALQRLKSWEGFLLLVLALIFAFNAVRTPEFLTIRAQVPASEAKLLARTKVADFVLCRKDSASGDGRRPDSVEPGTVLDDLARRDFTMNAIARDVQTGEVLDPHGGREDIKWKTLRFVGDPMTRIREDGLRVLRGLRFMITKGLRTTPARSRPWRSGRTRRGR